MKIKIIKSVIITVGMMIILLSYILICLGLHEVVIIVWVLLQDNFIIIVALVLQMVVLVFE